MKCSRCGRERTAWDSPCTCPWTERGSPALAPDLPGERRSGAEGTRTAGERENALQTLKRHGIAEVHIMRKPEPSDVVVLSVDYGITAEQAHALDEEARRVFGCRVAVLTPGVRIVSPTASPQEDADR